MYGFVRSNEKSNVLQPTGCRGDAEAVSDADVGGETKDGRRDDGEHAEDDEHHDLDVGPGHGLHSAEHGVDDGRQRNRQRRQRQVPTQNERKDDGGRGDDGAALHASGDEEQQAGERAGLRVEPALEVLVGRIHPRVVEEGHERDAEDDHRQRQREVELDEAETVVVALTGGPDHRDGAQLRGHHREAGRPPGNRSVGQEVAVDPVTVTRPLEPVVEDPRQDRDEDRPVDGTHSVRRRGHEKYSWKA